MKKIILGILFLLGTVKIQAQSVTLTEGANMPMVGDSVKYYLVDSLGINISSINNISGTNVTWNYSSLSLLSNSLITTRYKAPSAVPSASAYPTCNVVEGTTNFYKNTNGANAQTELVGNSLTGFTAALNFSNPVITAKYPFTSTNTFTDSFSGSVTFTSNGTFNGTSTLTADGTGTIVLPGGQTIPNVLRVRSRQNSTISGIIPIVPIAVRLTNYDYYAAGIKFPVFSVAYTSIAILTPTVTGQITSNTANAFVGIEEKNLEVSNAIITYPNPASDIVTIFNTSQAIDIKNISIYNQLGQLININSSSLSEISVKALSAGVYYLRIETNKGIANKRLVKE